MGQRTEWSLHNIFMLWDKEQSGPYMTYSYMGQRTEWSFHNIYEYGYEQSGPLTYSLCPIQMNMLFVRTEWSLHNIFIYGTKNRVVLKITYSLWDIMNMLVRTLHNIFIYGTKNRVVLT